MPTAVSLGIHLATGNMHYFHVFLREDIQTGSFHCPVEDGAAADKSGCTEAVRWCVLAAILYGELLMEWSDF